MQGDTSIDVRIDPDLPFSPGPPVARVPYDAPRADVVVASGEKPPPPIRREAVVRVDGPVPAWEGVPVDLAVTFDELARDTAGIVQQARARRLALRPSPHDADEDVFAAIRSLVRADLAEIARPSDDAALAPILRATRGGTVIVPSASAIAARFGAVDLELDGLVARALGPTDADGVLLLGVARDGAGWLEREGDTIRSVLEAMVLRRAEERVRAVEARAEESSALLRRLLSVGGHDLSNLLFAAHLAVAAIQRQTGPTPPLEKLGRSITGAVRLVRRVVDTGVEILGGPTAGEGEADLRSVFERVRDQLASDHPGRTIDGALPDLQVAVSDVVVERLLTVVLSNAVLHSQGPVTVRGDVGLDAVTVEVCNAGQLPFDDLARLRPFEHRSNRSLGAGLWSARRLAGSVRGVGLGVTQQGEDVKALLRLPIARIPMGTSSYGPS